MAYLLQFCGVSDPLQLFHLEQSSLAVKGPAFAGFRPFQLDDLLDWALDAARQRSWDLELIQRTVLDGWMQRAEAIRQWQLRLLEEPRDHRVIAGLGTQRDWQRRCEALLMA